MRILKKLKKKQNRQMASQPCLLLRISNGGYIDLFFNPRYKRGILIFAWLPWEVPLGIKSSRVKELLDYFFNNELRVEDGSIARFEYCDWFDIGDTFAIFENKVKRIAPIKKPKYNNYFFCIKGCYKNKTAIFARK